MKGTCVIDWFLRTGRGRVIHSPSWEDIRESLYALDGTTSSEVELQQENKHLLIEGGDEGRYLVVYIPDDDPDASSLTLGDLATSGPDVKLTAQTPALFPARLAVQLPLVVQVVEQFYRTGTLPEDVYWEP